MTDDESGQALQGTSVTPLSGVGTAFRYDPDADLSLPEPPEPGSVDPDTQWDRFLEAREAVHEQLQTERRRTAERVGEEEAEIFEAHRQFLADPTIEAGVEESLRKGLPAEHAVDGAFADAIEQFEAAGGVAGDRVDDPRELRDRLLETLRSFDGSRVVARTLDVGGDKPVPYLDLEKGETSSSGSEG
jgi:phosphotransferase system enzyme I (PtsI)